MESVTDTKLPPRLMQKNKFRKKMFLFSLVILLVNIAVNR
jgi:hypothetical protein